LASFYPKTVLTYYPNFPENIIISRIWEKSGSIFPYRFCMVNSPKKRILLAEDDASMRRFVEVVLHQANYDVSTAEDGLAAMTLIHENDFDLILVDAIMPNFSGFDVCRMLRADEKRNKIPIVILSGLADQSSDTSAQLANAFLIKDSNLKKNLIKTLQIMIPKMVQA